MFELHHGDCIEIMRTLDDNSIDAIVTDPPYELGFMGKSWDASGIAYNVDMWREALRVLKPGGHLLAFSGSRTYHRMTCAIEDAGFEVRDQIMWVYGSGFPKSLDVSKAIDKAAGAEREVIGQEKRGGGRQFADGASGFARGMVDITVPSTDEARQWDGWGTALKPAHEPICVARKPLVGTVAANVLEFGAGALNIDDCRIEGAVEGPGTTPRSSVGGTRGSMAGAMDRTDYDGSKGRWPANLIHDGSDEVVALFPNTTSGAMKREVGAYEGESATGFLRGRSGPSNQHGDTGSAARFFYCAKASKSDRGAGNHHPTVKPTDLMAYLCRLVTPPGGTVLDPFMGSGSTGKAAMREGFQFVGIDMTPEYVDIATARIEHELNQIAKELAG